MKAYTNTELENKTVAELRQICYQNGIVGMSKKAKSIIIDAIMKKSGVGDTPSEETAKPISLTKLAAGLVINKTNGNAKATVVVSCGAASGEFPVVGRKISEIAALLGQALNVDMMSVGMVNGKQVDNSYIIQKYDTLEFIKPAGSKGRR